MLKFISKSVPTSWIMSAALLFSLISPVQAQSVHWPIWPARACEIFVDRVAPVAGPLGWKGLTFWVKTLNFRLDGPIRRVGFRYRLVPTAEAVAFCRSRAGGRSADCADLGRWRMEDLRPFAGAEDYFEGPRFGLALNFDAGFPHQYEGFFFVTTARGTSFRTVSGLGLEFLLDGAMYDNLTRVRGQAQGMPDQASAVVAADQFAYLNPLRCR